jgi:hypothetical protein
MEWEIVYTGLVGALVYGSVGNRVHHVWGLFGIWSFLSANNESMGIKHGDGFGG